MYDLTRQAKKNTTVQEIQGEIQGKYKICNIRKIYFLYEVPDEVHYQILQNNVTVKPKEILGRTEIQSITTYLPA